MPLDRAAALRNAEKMLRQGKLDAAIAEYARIVEDHPRDWNTTNLLGDLYVRARQVDKAVQQFTRIADHLNQEGFLPKAAALYKKTLKIKPDDEHSLVQAAEIAATQGLLADARAYLNTLAETRLARGDRRGAAQAKIRLGSLDAADFDARSIAARARVDLGDTAGALEDFKAIAAELSEKGREAEAVEALRRAADIDPADGHIRDQLVRVYVATGDFARARECASSVEQLQHLASALESAGRTEERLEILRSIARLDPGAAGVREELARALIARGDVTAAAEYLTEGIAGTDPQLLLTVAELHLRGGRIDEGLAVVRRLLDADPGQREAVALLSWKIAAAAPVAAFHLAETAADASVALSDWPAAAATLQEFVTRIPNHLPALMRLVEICVDGGLEATMYSAQAQLADAYIAAGSGSEARVIAEDLVAREPWERANVERFRRALVLLGEPDPDGVIAERLSGQAPFTSTDLSIDFSDVPGFEEEAAATDVPAAAEPAATSPGGSTAAPVSGQAPTATRSQFDLGANAIDLESILGDIQSDQDRKPSRPAGDHVEVDLSVVLDDINASAAEQPAADIEEVFANLRDEAARRSAMDNADEQYRRGVALHSAGDVDAAVVELEAAARTPRFRFAAAALLARIARSRGRTVQAVEWFERAAQAPAPTADEGYQLLYELADALESEGEVARALAVCLELQADAGEFRDVAARIDRLARVQTRG